MNAALSLSAETELRNFWTAARELASARRRRNVRTIRLAEAELSAIAMHSERPVLRNAALRLLAA